MKRKFMIMLITGVAYCLSFQIYATTVKVELMNVSNNKGYISAGICPKKGFLKKYKDCQENHKLKAVEGLMELIFEDIPEGKYAIMLYHDENNNGKMDTNFLGIPKEGYGVSNDAKGRFSAPSFEKAAFDVGKSDLELKIHLTY